MIATKDEIVQAARYVLDSVASEFAGPEAHAIVPRDPLAKLADAVDHPLGDRMRALNTEAPPQTDYAATVLEPSEDDPPAEQADGPSDEVVRNALERMK